MDFILYFITIEILMAFSFTRVFIENLCLPYIVILLQDFISYNILGRTLFSGILKHVVAIFGSLFSDNNILQELKPEFNYVIRITALIVYIASNNY